MGSATRVPLEEQALVSHRDSHTTEMRRPPVPIAERHDVP